MDATTEKLYDAILEAFNEAWEDDGLFMIDEIILLAHGTDMETGQEHVARYFALEEDTLMAELFEGIDRVLQALSDRSEQEG